MMLTIKQKWMRKKRRHLDVDVLCTDTEFKCYEYGKSDIISFMDHTSPKQPCPVLLIAMRCINSRFPFRDSNYRRVEL